MGILWAHTGAIDCIVLTGTQLVVVDHVTIIILNAWCTQYQ